MSYWITEKECKLLTEVGQATCCHCHFKSANSLRVCGINFSKSWRRIYISESWLMLQFWNYIYIYSSWITYNLSGALKRQVVPICIGNLKDAIWPHTVPLHCICNMHVKYYKLHNFLLHSLTLLIKPAITGNCVKPKTTDAYFSLCMVTAGSRGPVLFLENQASVATSVPEMWARKSCFMSRKWEFFRKKKLFSEVCE